MRVPIVDLDGWNDATARIRNQRAAEVCDAFLRFGFVRVTGHGVPISQLSAADDQFRAFFARDSAEKLGLSGAAGGQRGFTPFGREHAKDHAIPDQKEFFHVGQPSPKGAFSRSDYPRNVFPITPIDFGDTCIDLYRSFERASQRMLELVEIGMRLAPGCLTEMIDGGNSILRALHYPPTEVVEGDPFDRPHSPSGHTNGRAYRAAPHEDINLVTLLPASDEPGLEILVGSSPEGEREWIPVVAGPGEIIADVGDMLARVTGGQLPATTHRVIAADQVAARHRYAYPFFAHPRPECDLSVLPGFRDRPGAENLEPIDARRFLSERLREIGLAD